MRFLLKASEERSDFYELIGKEVTFKSDISYVSGMVIHKKGEKGFISDIEYNPGYWSALCPNIYVKPKVSTFKINGIPATSWRPDTFVEFA